MKEEEQIRAVAEWEGWKWDKCKGSEMLKEVYTPKGGRRVVMFIEDILPDYHSDVDALRPVLLKLDQQQRVDFLNIFRDLVIKKLGRKVSDFDMLCAEPALWLEAVCRAIWPERWAK